MGLSVDTYGGTYAITRRVKRRLWPWRLLIGAGSGLACAMAFSDRDLSWAGMLLLVAGVVMVATGIVKVFYPVEEPDSPLRIPMSSGDGVPASMLGHVNCRMQFVTLKDHAMDADLAEMTWDWPL